MAKTRRAYSGNAASTTLVSGINDSATTMTITAATGWPSGAPFYVVIDPGTAAEEKILVTRSSTTLTVSGSRGADDTAASSHSAGATIYPVFTATDANEANLMASTLTTKGDLLTHSATDFARVAVGSNNQVLVADSAQTNGLKWATVTSAMITDGTIAATDLADGAVTEAKIGSGAVTEAKLGSGSVTEAKIGTGAVTSDKIADGTIVDADVNASAAIALSKLATGALPTAITVASANIVDGTIVNADINASAAIALSKLATGALPSGITISSSNISNNSIVNDDISSTANIEPTKLQAIGLGRKRTTDATISNNSWTDLLFGTSDFSQGSVATYNASTGQIEFTYAGLYVVTASVRFSANATGTRGIRINDGIDILAQQSVMAAPSGGTVVSCHRLYYNEANPSIKVQVFQSSGGNLDVEGVETTYFQIAYLGSNY